MKLLIDSHVHVYPNYDLARFFHRAWLNLSSGAVDLLNGSQTIPVLMLTERHDCSFFRDLIGGRFELPNGLEIRSCGANSVQIGGAGGMELVIIAGRQIVSAERIEVLALLADLALKDGQPIDELIPEISRLGAFPVLPWSPGKWFSSRGQKIEQILLAYKPGQIGFSDSALRPAGWPLPRLLQMAGLKSFVVIAGSDPLPLSGEEERAGSYFTAADAPSLTVESGAQQIEDAVRTILMDPQSPGRLISCGRRLTPLALLTRLFRLKSAA